MSDTNTISATTQSPAGGALVRSVDALALVQPRNQAVAASDGQDSGETNDGN